VNRRPPSWKDARRGASLVMAVVTLLLVESFCALAATATAARARVAGDARFAIEGWLVARSAEAEAMLSLRDTMLAMTDGEQVLLGWQAGPAGWRHREELRRNGTLLRLTSLAEWRDAAGTLHASQRSTLLVSRASSDTLRVLDHRARW
jgi:hypothetical protein